MILVFIFSIYKIFTINKEYKEIDDDNQKIIEIAITSEDEDKKNNSKDDNNNNLKIDWDKLKNINKDIIAWINIEDTNINYPIVQGNDNEQYLRNNLYGKYSKGGCPFVDCRTKKPFEDNNTIIYGHHLDNGSMFSAIKYYANKEYFNSHRIINIYTKDGQKKEYTVFSYGIASDNNKKIYNTDVENLNTYYDEVRKISQNFIQDNNIGKNKIITLSTCTNNDKSQRYVLQAYLNN